MARSNINDYVLEIGWDGRKVDKGITTLEKRINKLAVAAERLSKQQTEWVVRLAHLSESIRVVVS